MTRTRLLVPLLAATALLLSGCGGTGDGGTTADTETKPAPTAEAEPSSLETVFEEVDCSEDDPLGSAGRIEAADAPATRTATCYPFGSEELAFFWEFEDAAAATAWLDSGELEVGLTDAVFIDDRVVILTNDASNANDFAELYETVE